MGVNLETLRCLIYAKERGADFGFTATIGRQAIRHTNESIVSLLKENRINIAEGDSLVQDDGFSEKLFTELGASVVDSFDYSDYENATFKHDFNMPISSQFKNKYSFLFDGGSLEHIFNFPVAIKNVMEMLKIDGVYVGIHPANNQSGHGFYQMSPEIYYRVFCQDNGFEIINILAYKAKSDKAEIYSVMDPKIVGRRVGINGLGEINLCVIAKKKENRAIFKKWPQQSDYEGMWAKNEVSEMMPKKSFKKLKFRLWYKSLRVLKKVSPVLIEPYTAFEIVE